MESIHRNACIVALIIILLVTGGCVTPPKAGTTSSSGSGTTDQGTGAGAPVTTVASYITIDTPFQTPTQLRTVIVTPTLDPNEEFIDIYTTTQIFAYNKTAVSFNLSRPPMLIHFKITPAMVKDTKYISESKYQDQSGEQSISTEYISPSSWFEVTVRDKHTGAILAKDGFGASKQYSTELERTIKVINRNLVLVELGGNQVTAEVNVSVKRGALSSS